MSVQIVHVLGCGTACIVFVDSWETWHKTAKQMLIQGFMRWYILSRCFVWFNEDTDVPSIPEMPAPNTTALGPDFSRGQTQKYFDHTQVRCPESGRTSRVLDPSKTSSGGFNSMTCWHAVISLHLCNHAKGNREGLWVPNSANTCVATLIAVWMDSLPGKGSLRERSQGRFANASVNDKLSMFSVRNKLR